MLMLEVDNVNTQDGMPRVVSKVLVEVRHNREA